MKYTNTLASYRDGDESGSYTVPETTLPVVFESNKPNEALAIESYIDLQNGDNDVDVVYAEVDGNGDIHSCTVPERPVVVCRDEAMATAITNALNVSPLLIEGAPGLLEACEAAHQCITDFLEVYKNGGTMLVMDEAVKSLRTDALKKVKGALAKATGESPSMEGRAL